MPGGDLGKELDKVEDLHRLADEVQCLGDALKTKEERTGNLVEAKGKYKTMVIGLRDMEAAAQDKIRVLEAAVEEGEAGRPLVPANFMIKPGQLPAHFFQSPQVKYDMKNA
jgi:hypothetical protein